LIAYTRLPTAPPELDELLELDELDVELEELEDELDELDDEVEELDDELEELLEDPEPPQAIKRVMSERGSNSRIFNVKPSK
jgi:predicted nuclease with TOPRIM domain